MERTEILEKLKQLLSGVKTVNATGLENLTENSDFIADLGLPSSELINVVATAEDEFDLEFDDDDVDSLDSSVKSTVDLIHKAYQEQHGA